MSINRNRLSLLVGLSVLLVATGCLRAATDANLEAPPAQGLRPSPTPPTQEVLEVVRTEIIVVTATPDPLAEPLDPLAEEQTFEDLSEFAEGVQANPFGVFGEGEGTLVAQEQDPQATLDPNFQLATDIVASATQEIIDQTATAEGPAVEVPFFTNTPDLAFEPPTATPFFVAGSDCIHEVRTGENMFRLSMRYGVLVNDIARVSNPPVSNVNLIYPGQMLTIPGCGTTGAVPPPTTIPAQTGATGGDGTFAPAGGGTTGGFAGGVQHTVQQGETLFQISLRYNVPVMTIASANGIANIDRINMNQTLTIP